MLRFNLFKIHFRNPCIGLFLKHELEPPQGLLENTDSEALSETN